MKRIELEFEAKEGSGDMVCIAFGEGVLCDDGTTCYAELNCFIE